MPLSVQASGSREKHRKCILSINSLHYFSANLGRVQGMNAHHRKGCILSTDRHLGFLSKVCVLMFN